MLHQGHLYRNGRSILIFQTLNVKSVDRCVGEGLILMQGQV